MPSLVTAGIKRRPANSSNPSCDSHTSMTRKPVSVGWEICWYIPGSGRASTLISSNNARNSLWVSPVMFIVMTTVFIVYSPAFHVGIFSLLAREPHLGKVYPDGLVLRVALQCLGAMLAAIAAHLESAKRRVWVVLVPCVEPYGASLDAICDPKGLAEIRSLNAGSKAVGSVVRQANRFVLIFEWNHRQ